MGTWVLDCGVKFAMRNVMFMRGLNELGLQAADLLYGPRSTEPMRRMNDAPTSNGDHSGA